MATTGPDTFNAGVGAHQGQRYSFIFFGPEPNGMSVVPEWVQGNVRTRTRTDSDRMWVELSYDVDVFVDVVALF